MRQVTATWRTRQPLVACDFLDLLSWKCPAALLAWPTPPTWASMGRADGWGKAVQGGIIRAEEAFPSEYLNADYDGGWVDTGSTLIVEVRLCVQKMFRERGHSLLTRQGRNLLLSQFWDVERKNSLAEHLWDSSCSVNRTLVNSSGEEINQGHGRFGSYFSPSTIYFIISPRIK